MDELSKIEDLASLFLTVSEIAFECNISETDLRREIRGKTTPRAKAYFRGKIKTKIAMRRQILDFAIAGSPQSEILMNDFSNEQNSDE
jgi:hypothetical protein